LYYAQTVEIENIDRANTVTRDLSKTMICNIGEKMNKKIMLIVGLLTFAAVPAHADEATEQEVMKAIIDANAYTKENLKGQDDTVASEGSLEFWSSGGLLHKVSADISPQEFESFNLDVKYIKVITLVPGKAAVAQYYSEGSVQGKGEAAVHGYRTRATEVFVKEDGKWKVRAAHWSPIAGGKGTSSVSVVED